MGNSAGTRVTLKYIGEDPIAYPSLNVCNECEVPNYPGSFIYFSPIRDQDVPVPPPMPRPSNYAESLHFDSGDNAMPIAPLPSCSETATTVQESCVQGDNCEDSGLSTKQLPDVLPSAKVPLSVRAHAQVQEPVVHRRLPPTSSRRVKRGLLGEAIDGTMTRHQLVRPNRRPDSNRPSRDTSTRNSGPIPCQKASRSMYLPWGSAPACQPSPAERLSLWSHRTLNQMPQGGPNEPSKPGIFSKLSSLVVKGVGRSLKRDRDENEEPKREQQRRRILGWSSNRTR